MDPSNLKKSINVITSGLQNTHVYVDDCLVDTESREDHYQALYELLTSYDKFSVKVQLEKKCKLVRSEVR
jgi:hypothetical protein